MQSRLYCGVSTLIAVIVLFSSIHRSDAAIFDIANGDVTALVNTISLCQINNADDTINLAANGTYFLTRVDNTTVGPSGLPVITGDNGQHSLTIHGNGATITRFGNAPAFRVFTLRNLAGGVAGSVFIDNLTISNGLGAASGGDAAFGGGIWNSGVTLTLTNCSISGNFAGVGGGIFNTDETVTLMNCALVNNSAGSGGAISNDSTSPPSSRTALIRLTNCTLSGNTITGLIGAAISNSEFDNSINGAPEARIDLTGCTLSGNSGSPGAFGIYDEATHGHTQVSLANCILNQCTLKHDSVNGGIGGIVSGGYNLSNDDGSGKLTETTDQINTDPGLDPLGLQNNGGATQTIALTSGSRAIDKGKSFGLTTDQRGSPRPYDNPSVPNASDGDGSDIGAYEVAQGQDPVQGGIGFVVTTTDDHDDGVCGGADCALREAVARANSVPGDNSIIFAHSLTGSITLTMGELAVTDSLTITGIPIGTISGNNASRVFRFTGGSSYLFGLTIRDGLSDVNFPGQTNTGGGIYNSATLSVYGCSFVNNHAVGVANTGAGSGGKGEGGGIYNSGTLLVDGSTFSQTNEAIGGNGGNGNFGHGGVPSGNGGAGQGGAIFNATDASLSITNSTFNQNIAQGGNGGSGGPSGGNGGNGDSGAIYNLGALTIKSATISGNSGGGGAAGTGTVNGVAGAGSGGIRVAGGTIAIANTIVAGNVGNNGGAQDVGGAFSSSGYNLVGIGDFSSGFSATGDQVGTTAAPINPLLGPLQSNGGNTSTMLPQTGSPALDRGFAFGLTSDQRGRSRPFDDPAIPNASGGDGSDIGAVEIGSGPAPISVVSRKVHDVNLNQSFDIQLSADTLGDECRSGGAGGNYTLIFTFGSPVTFTSASVCSGTGTVSSANVSGSQVTVNLAGVTQAEVLTMCLGNVSDGTTSGNVSFPLRVLVGDTTGNGSVNASDVSITKLKSGQAVDATNFREDVTVNNSINASDVSLVKSRSGTALPP